MKNWATLPQFEVLKIIHSKIPFIEFTFLSNSFEEITQNEWTYLKKKHCFISSKLLLNLDINYHATLT